MQDFILLKTSGKVHAPLINETEKTSFWCNFGRAQNPPQNIKSLFKLDNTPILCKKLENSYRWIRRKTPNKRTNRWTDKRPEGISWDFHFVSKKFKETNLAKTKLPRAEFIFNYIKLQCQK